MSGSPETSAKILAVDDNPEAAAALADILQQEGFEVSTAGSGSETLEKARQENPDLILLDVQMPEPDGFEVTRILKGDPNLRYITVILLTAKDSLEDVIFGLDQGADDYIKKPFKRAELVARVKAAMLLI